MDAAPMDAVNAVPSNDTDLWRRRAPSVCVLARMQNFGARRKARQATAAGDKGCTAEKSGERGKVVRRQTRR
jgi:hypothetical protein